MQELITSLDLPQPQGWERVPQRMRPGMQSPEVSLLEGYGMLLYIEPVEGTSNLHAVQVTLKAKQKASFKHEAGKRQTVICYLQDSWTG